MANSMYAAFKQVQLGDAAVTGPTQVPSLESATVNAVLTDHGADTPNVNTDQDYADISTGTVGSATALASKTVVVASNTVTFDAADTTFTAVSGSSVESISLFNDSAGASSTDLLIVYFDTATGLPVTPNGGDIVVQWNASGIFSW